MNVSNFTIAGLAREAGVGVETVRYYQRLGLIANPPRSEFRGSIRRYGDDHVRRLKFIRSAQLAGFTLAEIGELIELDASHDRARARQLAESRIAILDVQIKNLQLARDSLAKLARACRQGKGAVCPIISSFEDPL